MLSEPPVIPKTVAKLMFEVLPKLSISKAKSAQPMESDKHNISSSFFINSLSTVVSCLFKAHKYFKGGFVTDSQKKIVRLKKVALVFI